MIVFNEHAYCHDSMIWSECTKYTIIYTISTIFFVSKLFWRTILCLNTVVSERMLRLHHCCHGGFRNDSFCRNSVFVVFEVLDVCGFYVGLLSACFLVFIRFDGGLLHRGCDSFAPQRPPRAVFRVQPKWLRVGACLTV